MICATYCTICGMAWVSCCHTIAKSIFFNPCLLTLEYGMSQILGYSPTRGVCGLFTLESYMALYFGLSIGSDPLFSHQLTFSTYGSSFTIHLHHQGRGAAFVLPTTLHPWLLPRAQKVISVAAAAAEAAEAGAGSRSALDNLGHRGPQKWHQSH